MNSFENEYVKFWFEDGILFSEFKYEIVLTLKHSEELIKIRHELSKGKNQYWVYSSKNIKEMTKETKEYANLYGQDFLDAAAILVHSPYEKFLMKIFFQVKKPKVKVKVFTEKEEAVKWITTIRNTALELGKN